MTSNLVISWRRSKQIQDFFFCGWEKTRFSYLCPKKSILISHFSVRDNTTFFFFFLPNNPQNEAFKVQVDKGWFMEWLLILDSQEWMGNSLPPGWRQSFQSFVQLQRQGWVFSCLSGSQQYTKAQSPVVIWTYRTSIIVIRSIYGVTLE